MLVDLVLGVATMLLCLLLQLLLLVVSLRFYLRHRHMVRTGSFARGLELIGGVMLLLLLGNLTQIAIWAGLFLQLEEFGRFSAAFYHSAVNFSTLGYGDVVMSPRHRLLGPLESLNGILMIGVSTSSLTWGVQHAIKTALQARGVDLEL
ncbi:MAG TPA: two pore domain potassium channel family protein [Sedimenticola thiotaurini]|uniref:Two pore domain potassium channel family protein n=1 Tax=Sedimenticola thiotaurini TaxID=1543721 RepID=A0A831W4Z2_9GAMM|nr:two pore domain potassium channel family protein [Sedimenticola thiotaurini]